MTFPKRIIVQIVLIDSRYCKYIVWVAKNFSTILAVRLQCRKGTTNSFIFQLIFTLSF